MLNDNDLIFLKQNLTFWNNITTLQQDKILNNTISIKYKKGDTIYSPSKECLGVILIKTGELRTYILSEDGKEVTLYRLNDGEVCILSSSCILKNITFDIYIDCEKNTEILLINSIIFSELITQNIYIENFALKTTVDKFSNVMWTMEQILFIKLDTRLAIFLLDEINKSKTTTLKITHEQIGKYIGSAREVISRMLEYFEEENIVKLSRGSIQIIDKNKLKNLIIHLYIWLYILIVSLFP